MSSRTYGRGSLAVALVAGITLASGCASTHMTDVWIDPAAKGAELTKVAVVCMVADDAVRRIAEDEMAKQLTGAQVTPSYRVLGTTDLTDKQTVKAKLRAAGYQAVLVMRLAGVSERLVPTYGPYHGFDGYYDYAAGATYPTTYLVPQTTVRVVSTLFSLGPPTDKLLWSGASNTFDPSSAKEVVTGVSRAVAKALEHDRIIG